MQLDYLTWLYKYGIYAAMIIGALILAVLARSRFAKTMDDSDKLQTPTYEHMDSGVTVSDPDDDENDP